MNCIAPGFVVTDGTVANMGLTKEQLEVFAKERTAKQVLARAGTTEDIADLVLFLASDDSSWITGQVIAVDGGRIDGM